MMVFIFLKNRIYFIAIFVGNRGLQTLMLGLYVLYSAAFLNFHFLFRCHFSVLFHFFVSFIAWMFFFFIPKTDTGLWLGLFFGSVHQLLFYLSQAIGSELTGCCCCCISWQYGSSCELFIMHLREFRLLIRSRNLSPALFSPQHLKPRIKPTYRKSHWKDWFLLITDLILFDRQGANWQTRKLNKSPFILYSPLPFKTVVIVKRCLYLNATSPSVISRFSQPVKENKPLSFFLQSYFLSLKQTFLNWLVPLHSLMI